MTNVLEEQEKEWPNDFSYFEWKHGWYYQNYKITGNSSALIGGVSETVKWKTKKQEGGFLGMPQC